MIRRFNPLMSSALCLLLSATACAEITIDTVLVGNPGNAADTRYDAVGYGAVDYTYSIGKYEVTSAQYVVFLNAVAATDAYGLYNTDMWSSDYGCKIQRSGSSGSYTYSVTADRASRPVNFVSWGDAARFTNWVHNGQSTGAQGSATTEDGAYHLDGATSDAALQLVTRETDARYWLPTENEWYKAAYHKNDGVTGNYFNYPTGSDDVPSNDLIDPDPGNNANFTIGSDDYTIGSPYYTTEVGAFENSESPYGTFDQGGNLYEWNETRTGPDVRGRRGGAWTSSSNALTASSSRTNLPYGPSHEARNVGFRVTSVPEPGSITLFLCGALASVLWWTRQR